MTKSKLLQIQINSRAWKEMKSIKIPKPQNLLKHCQVKKDQAIKNQPPRKSKGWIRNL